MTTDRHATSTTAAIREALDQLQAMRCDDDEAAQAMVALRLTRFQLERHLVVAALT